MPIGSNSHSLLSELMSVPAATSSTRRSFWYAAVLYSQTVPGSAVDFRVRSSRPLDIVSRWRIVIAPSSAALARVHPAGRYCDTGSSSSSRPRSRARPTRVELTLFWHEARSWVVSAVAPIQYCSATRRPSWRITSDWLFARSTSSTTRASRSASNAAATGSTVSHSPPAGGK
jgi:hypothetical protein